MYVCMCVYCVQCKVQVVNIMCVYHVCLCMPACVYAALPTINPLLAYTIWCLVLDSPVCNGNSDVTFEGNSTITFSSA